MEYMQEVVKLINLNQNKPLYENIYEGLRTAIIKGVIPMGVRINEKVYAKELNVSRTPIRVALHRLQDEGIVKHVPNFGIMVTRVTEKDVDEIYQIRVALDILASVNAAKAMTKERAEQMDHLLSQAEEAQSHGEVQRVIDLSKDFNTMIYKFADMPHLESIQTKLHDYLTRFRDISLMSDDRRQLAIEEHRLIFNFMRHKNFDALEKMITSHLYNSKEFIILEMDEELKNA
ncbi:GntR family transcriptional regulator [Atopobacter phocae]|uniref:GntR family transcriptional regulator n=1 Tax=Atopobacter phocae TaxID=136492 RepID=UPI00046FCB1C|nr:GntR family transcriptional regulator [Atopobacter phocae]